MNTYIMKTAFCFYKKCFCNWKSGWYIWTIYCKNHKFVKYENNESSSCMTENIRISSCYTTYMHAYTSDFKTIFIGKVLNTGKASAWSFNTRRISSNDTQRRPFTYLILSTKKENTTEPHRWKVFGIHVSSVFLWMY